MVNQLEERMSERVKQGLAGMADIVEKSSVHLQKRIGEQHTYSSELKDEMDRIADRLKANQTEVLNYNKNLATSLKKIRGDQLVQDDDLSRAWNVVSLSLECLHNLLSCFESQANEGTMTRQHTNPQQTPNSPSGNPAVNFEQVLRQAGE